MKNKVLLSFVLVFSILFLNTSTFFAMELEDPQDLDSNIETLDLNDDDFTDGSLLVSHSFLYGSTGVKTLVDNTAFSNGLSVQGSTRFSGAQLAYAVQCADRIIVKKANDEKMFSKGSSLDFSLSNLVSYVGASNGKEYNFASWAVSRFSVIFKDINGSYHTIDCSDYTVSSADGYTDISFTIDEIPCDTYGVYIVYYYKFGEGFCGDNIFTSSYTIDRWGGFYNSMMSFTETPYDKTDSLLGGITDFIKSILQGIIDLPSKIANSIKGFFDNIVNAITNMVNALKDKLQSVLDGIVNALTALGNFILDGLKSLFIPSDEFFDTYFDNLYGFFSEKLGFLLYPFDLIARLLNAYLGLADGSGTIVIDDVVMFDTVIIKATTFDLKGAISSVLGDYYNLYYAFVDCILLAMFVNYGRKKFDLIVGGVAT